jgi:hypothetical protein
MVSIHGHQLDDNVYNNFSLVSCNAVFVYLYYIYVHVSLIDLLNVLGFNDTIAVLRELLYTDIDRKISSHQLF